MLLIVSDLHLGVSMSPGAGTLSLHILSSEHGEPLMPPFSLHAVHSSHLGSAWLLLAFLVKVLFQLLLWTPLPPPPFCSVRERIQITLSEKEAESSETTVCKKPAKPIQGDISLFFFFFFQTIILDSVKMLNFPKSLQMQIRYTG